MLITAGVMLFTAPSLCSDAPLYITTHIMIMKMRRRRREGGRRKGERRREHTS